jgi:hypothetical protein
MKNDVPRLFPGREKEIIFHQDSASNHTDAKTKEFFKERKVKYVTPEECLRFMMQHPWTLESGAL